MRHVKVLAAAMAVAAGVTFAAAAEDSAMDGGALRKTVVGKTVHLATPLGGLPINYRADGTMWGRAGSLAAYTGSERDRGRWWVVADKLCQRWNTWLGGRSYCFTLRQQGTGTVHWTRNDGLSGTATIVR
jgi:hypothetical protein